MRTLSHPLEKLVEAFECDGAAFEVVRRPDVLWVGCVARWADGSGEAESEHALARFRRLVEVEPIRERICEDWSAALTLYRADTDKPCGVFYGNESRTS